MAAPLDPRSSQKVDQQADHLERLIGTVLSQHPPRRAPASLQARVFAEIERRAALPWWRMSFLHWPLLVRVAFVLGSLAIVKFVFSSTVLLSGRVQTDPVVNTLARPFSWAERTADSVSRAVSFTSTLVNAIPSLWLAAGIGIAVTLYFALVVLGTTAYRTLYVNK